MYRLHLVNNKSEKDTRRNYMNTMYVYQTIKLKWLVSYYIIEDP